eukprot:TRINITY_DN2357_c0_g1_i2.p1 TRINITY_DN2357_c0_g1~~TRINITY_DN2357_c0_g1_i2.p1  ORF type:complete len:562 (+),score=140.27 TRINITY_DN2357_c0_g1_i2:79-1686(+)
MEKGDEDIPNSSSNPLPAAQRRGRLAPLSIPPALPQRSETENVNSVDNTNNNNENNPTDSTNEQPSVRRTAQSSETPSGEKELQLEEERRKLRSQRFSNRRTKKVIETEPIDQTNTRESPRYISPRANQNQNPTPRRPNNLPPLQKNESQSPESDENNINSENIAQMSGLGRLSARRMRIRQNDSKLDFEKTDRSENESDNQQNTDDKTLNNNNNNNNFNNTNTNSMNFQNNPQINEEMARRSFVQNTSQPEMGIPYPTVPAPNVNTFSNTRLQPSKRNEILFVESSDGKFKKMNKSTANRRNVGFEVEDDITNANRWDAYIEYRESFLSSLFMLVQGFMAGFSILQLYICYIASPPGKSMLSFLSYYSYVSSMIQHTYFLFSTICLLSAINKYNNDKRFNTPITPFHSQTEPIQTVPYRTIVVDIFLIVCYSIVFFSCIIIAQTEDLFYYTQLSQPNWFASNPVVYYISKSQINAFHAFNILRILGSLIAWVLIVKESNSKNSLVNPVFVQSTTMHSPVHTQGDTFSTNTQGNA